MPKEDTKPEVQNIERDADRRADRLSFLFVAAFVFLSWVVLSSSEKVDAQKFDYATTWIEPWLTQLTSHAAILMSVLVIPFFLNRFPITWANWIKQIPTYILVFIIFSAIHIILMDVFRRVSFPTILGRPYTDSLLDLNIWIYELRKDAYSFLLILSVFLTGRHIEQLRREATSSLKDAKESGRLTLKSGGRTIFLNADDIVWAESASNYVDIHTEHGQHLARITLATLEKLLSEAGDQHVRVHRSYVVKRDALREIVPSGEGGASIKLTNGTVLPVGRKYRPNLNGVR